MKIFNKIILFSLFILLIGCKNNQDDDLNRLKASLALKNIQEYENSKSTEDGQYNLEILIEKNKRNQLKGHRGNVVNANFSPDGKTIITASADNSAKVWDTTGKLLATLPSQPDGNKGHRGDVVNANFSPDGKTILTASRDKTAKVWDTTGKLLATLKGHISSVYNANFSPDGKTIVTASWDNSAKVWDTTGKLLATLKDHTNWVYNANFSPDGKTIVTASFDNSAKIWDTTGKLLATLPSQPDANKGHTSSVVNANYRNNTK